MKASRVGIRDGLGYEEDDEVDAGSVTEDKEVMEEELSIIA